MESKLAKRRRNRLMGGLFSVIILALSGVFIVKSMHIYEQSRERTEQYLIDVTYQLHEHIETQIQKSLEMLRLIRNGALDVAPGERKPYLVDQTAFSNFSSLHMVNDFDQAEQWLWLHYGEQYTLDRELLRQGKAQLIAIPGESTVVYFTAGQMDADRSVIIGVKENDLLKELLSDNNFDGQALTLVITQTGTVIRQCNGVLGEPPKFAFGYPNAMLAKLTGLEKRVLRRFLQALLHLVQGGFL